MKHIVWKAYWDFEKEEKWLNEMSAKGMALTDYSWCRYVFTETQNNEFTYRIELLQHLPSHAESAAYIRFLEESGIECVATYWRWIYLRKKSSEGPFDIYSDLQSKIKHYKRVIAFFGVIGAANLFAILANIIDGVAVSIKYNYNWLSNLSPIVLSNGVIAIGLAWLVMRYQRKISRLKKEKQLHE